MIAIPYSTKGLGTTPSTGSTVISAIGSGILATAPLTGPIGLIAGAATMVFGAIAGAIGLGTGCGQTCIQATTDVNQIEPYLQANLAWWQSPSTQHTIANQQTGIATFNVCWQQVLSLCSNPALGTAGKNCIGDRQRGGKWDWFKMYLDPIANSPTIDSGTISGEATILGEQLGLGSNGAEWIGIAVLAIGLLMVAHD